MYFLKKLTSWYKKQVALATGDISKYISAEKKVKISIILSPLLVLLGIFILYPLFGDPLFGLLMTTVMAFVPWLIVVDVIASISSFSKSIDEEMPFVIAMVAGVARTGMELIEALRFLTKSRVFKAFKNLSERFWSLSENLGASEGLRLLSRMLRGRGRFLLLEYSATLISGTALYYLRDRAVDFIKTAGVEFEKSMTTKMILAMMTSMIFSLLPVILISIATLYTIEITEFKVSAEVPPWLLAIPFAIILVTSVMCSLLPGYPLPARVVIEKRVLNLYRIIFATGVVILTLPTLQLILISDIQSFKELAMVTGIVAVALGAPSFIEIFKALNMNLDDVVERMANHVRIYRSMHLYRDKKLDVLVKRNVRPWLADYLRESSEFFKLIGDVDPNIFELFVNFVFEVQRIKKRASMYMFVMFGAAVASPFLAVATLQLGGSFGPTTITVLIGYVTTLSFAYIVSKLAIGRNMSTLLPGITTFIYLTML